MNASVLMPLLLLVFAGIVYCRPQWISTLRHYTDEERRSIDMQQVRRTAGGGLLLLALLTGPGSWLLAWGGVAETTLTVVRILVLVIGVIGIMARIETCKPRNK